VSKQAAVTGSATFGPAFGARVSATWQWASVCFWAIALLLKAHVRSRYMLEQPLYGGRLQALARRKQN
jgi:hypothetical protein